MHAPTSCAHIVFDRRVQRSGRWSVVEIHKANHVRDARIEFRILYTRLQYTNMYVQICVIVGQFINTFSLFCGRFNGKPPARPFTFPINTSYDAALCVPSSINFTHFNTYLYTHNCALERIAMCGAPNKWLKISRFDLKHKCLFDYLSDAARLPSDVRSLKECRKIANIYIYTSIHSHKCIFI